MKHTYLNNLATAGGLGLCLALSAPVSAQSAEAPGEEDATETEAEGPPEEASGEIRVTAQRREESLQDVPISIAVATADALEFSGVSSVQSLKVVTPGVEVQSNQGYAYPIIRGVGSRINGAGVETPVAVYVDGVYYAAATSTLLSFNNITRVEVLKGPQGTLFGRNASGGLIHVITKDPDQRFGGAASLSYGNYQTLRGEAYLTTGISENAAIDLAVAGTTMDDGYGTNVFTGNDVYRTDHDISARSKLLITPGSSTEIRIIGDYSDARSSNNSTRVPRGDTIPAPYGPVQLGGPWDTAANLDPSTVTSSWGMSLRVDQEVGALQLASITAYRHSNFDVSYDFDYTATPGRENRIRQKDRQFSQELQLLSPASGKLSWVLGAYYFNASGAYDPGVLTTFTGVAAPLPTSAAKRLVIVDQRTNSISAFGQATLEVAPDFNLTAGLRYTSEKRSLIDATQTTTLVNGTVTVVAPPNASVRFNKLTWRLAADYALNEDILAYVSYNRGFKVGGFNPNALTLPPFEPEVIDAYEGGLKTSWLDRDLRLNVAGFYYDYKNVQVQQTLNGSTGVFNGAAAEIYGADMDIQAELTSELSVTAGYQYLHGRYKAFPGSVIAIPRPAGGFGVTIGDVAGNRSIFSPKSTLSLIANYLIRLPGGEINLNGSYYYNSGFFFEPDNVAEQAEYSLVNASAKWTRDDGLSLTIWGNNLTNAVVANVFGLQSFGAAGLMRANYAPPLTYGVTVGIEF